MELPVSRTEVQRVVTEIARARSPSGSEAVGRLLDRLMSGNARVVDRFEGEQHRYLVAVENPPELVAAFALMPRERQLLRLAATGQSVKSIAVELTLSPSTAAGYLLAACRKTGLRSRREVIQWFSRCA